MASILIHLDFLSIFPHVFHIPTFYPQASILIHLDFLSIYILKYTTKDIIWASILIHLDFLSIYKILPPSVWILCASILIHLDFLSILIKHFNKEAGIKSFNPYSPGFSIYLNDNIMEYKGVRRLQSLFTWIFYLFKFTMKLIVRDAKLQSLFTWIFYLFTFIFMLTLLRI